MDEPFTRLVGDSSLGSMAMAIKGQARMNCLSLFLSL